MNRAQQLNDTTYAHDWCHSALVGRNLGLCHRLDLVADPGERHKLDVSNALVDVGLCGERELRRGPEEKM